MLQFTSMHFSGRSLPLHLARLTQFNDEFEMRIIAEQIRQGHVS